MACRLVENKQFYFMNQTDITMHFPNMKEIRANDL